MTALPKPLDVDGCYERAEEECRAHRVSVTCPSFCAHCDQHWPCKGSIAANNTLGLVSRIWELEAFLRPYGYCQEALPNPNPCGECLGCRVAKVVEEHAWPTDNALSRPGWFEGSL